MTSASAVRPGLGRVRWQLADVLEVRTETPRASRIRLRPPTWPGHLPGQHLDVRLTAPDGYSAQRSYSVASPPEADEVDIVVERLPDGEVSPYLTGELRAGDELEIRGPVGGWFLWHAGLGGPLRLIAGGSGVVPFLAMLSHHQAVDSDAEVGLLYSTRTLDDTIAGDWLLGLTPPVQVNLTLTRAAPSGWTGLRGRLDRDVLAEHAPTDGRPLVMICGPTAFVELVSTALVQIGHDPGRLKTERFGASGGTP
jgi:ferredoxin-NADP reductase